jgi:hypothetical protein
MRRAIAAGALVACLVLPAGAGAASYSNPTPLTLAPGPPDSGELFPYPSTISVGTEPGTITKLTATLVGITGAEVRQLNALLIGPGGRSILVTGACSAGGVIPDWSGQTVTFDDTVGTAIPQTCGVGGQPNGTFRPAHYNGAFIFPGVAPPYPVSLAAFNGTPPNGIWSLFVVDDNAADPLAVNGGWRLDITTTGAPPATPVPAKKRKCKRKKRKGAASAKRKRCKKKRRG